MKSIVNNIYKSYNLQVPKSGGNQKMKLADIFQNFNTLLIYSYQKIKFQTHHSLFFHKNKQCSSFALIIRTQNPLIERVDLSSLSRTATSNIIMKSQLISRQATLS